MTMTRDERKNQKTDHKHLISTVLPCPANSHKVHIKFTLVTTEHYLPLVLLVM